VAPPAPDAAPGSTEAHQQRLQVLLAAGGTAAPATRRRGGIWQRPQRQLEQEVRQGAVAFRQWVAARGLSRIDSAGCLGLSVRTLREWEDASATASLTLALRGRPVVRSPRAQRMAVLELLASVGPGVGLAVLQGQFPEMPRAELADLLRRYRRVWQRWHPPALHVLHWQRPGAVWAMDYAEPPLPLEEGFADLLAVRDLASGMQLLWLPVPEATARTTVAALLWLFSLYGAPLVLKMDNGAPFVASALHELLAQWQVLPLYSPAWRPQYNGAIEAGIGARKARTHYQAAREGHPGAWTLANTEAAREQANTLGRPWGVRGPTPAARWAGRQTVTVADRTMFAATVARLQAEAELAGAVPAPAAAAPRSVASADAEPSVAVDEPLPAAAAPALAEVRPVAPAVAATPRPLAAGSAPAAPTATAAPARPGPAPAPPRAVHPEDSLHEAHNPGTEAAPPSQARAAAQRQAISRALVVHGYLLFTRRRIPLPITRKKVSEIP
jgi:hypothetical protein